MKKISLFVLGDSISIHYGPYLRKYLGDKYDYDRKRDPGILKRDLDKPVGGNGEDSKEVLKYLAGRKKAGTLNFDIILLNCGLHDIKIDPKTGKHQVSSQEYKKNLKKVVSLLRKTRARIIWVRTTHVCDRIHRQKCRSFLRLNRDVKRYNKISDIIMKKSRIQVIDLNRFTRGLKGNLFIDHVHFMKRIRKLQASFIAHSL